MLGACITLSGVRRLGRLVVCKKKTNLRTVGAVNGVSGASLGSHQAWTFSISDCRRAVASICEVWHKTIKKRVRCKGIQKDSSHRTCEGEMGNAGNPRENDVHAPRPNSIYSYLGLENANASWSRTTRIGIGSTAKKRWHITIMNHNGPYQLASGVESAIQAILAGTKVGNLGGHAV